MNYFAGIKWFKPWEFDSPDQPGSGHGMNHDLVYILDQIRIRMKRRIDINSGVRTRKHNKIVGGVDDSSHLSGEAADVDCPDSNFRYWFIFWAQALKIRRIFIYDKYLHIDIDKKKAQNILVYVKSKRILKRST